MPQKLRAPRSDATRNHARVLQAAFEVFSEQGTAAPISDIATRAGVGAGTIYRNFPTKQALFRAVVADRFGRVAEYGQQIKANGQPDDAFFTFLRTLIIDGGDNRALADAIIGSEFDMLDAEDAFLQTLQDLLRDAQAAGAVRDDIGVMEVKALLAACYTVRSYDEPLIVPVMNVVLDGLKTSANRTGDKTETEQKEPR